MKVVITLLDHYDANGIVRIMNHCVNKTIKVFSEVFVLYTYATHSFIFIFMANNNSAYACRPFSMINVTNRVSNTNM